jgi:hypothetical protein
MYYTSDYRAAGGLEGVFWEPLCGFQTRAAVAPAAAGEATAQLLPLQEKRETGVLVAAAGVVKPLAAAMVDSSAVEAQVSLLVEMVVAAAAGEACTLLQQAQAAQVSSSSAGLRGTNHEKSMD